MDLFTTETPPPLKAVEVLRGGRSGDDVPKSGTTLMADGRVRGSRYETIHPNRAHPNGKDNRFSSRSGQIP